MPLPLPTKLDDPWARPFLMVPSSPAAELAPSLGRRNAVPSLEGLRRFRLESLSEGDCVSIVETVRKYRSNEMPPWEGEEGSRSKRRRRNGPYLITGYGIA